MSVVLDILLCNIKHTLMSKHLVSVSEFDLLLLDLVVNDVIFVHFLAIYGMLGLSI